MPPDSSTLSPSRFSSNWNPYWNPEERLRLGDAGRGRTGRLLGAGRLGTSRRGRHRGRHSNSFYLGSKQRRPTSDSIIPCHPERSEVYATFRDLPDLPDLP